MKSNTLTKSLFDTAKNKEDIQLRINLLKYLDEVFYQKQEFLFFNMLEYTRFVNELKSIAYTTKDKLIFLNYPTPLMENNDAFWEFIHAHECLHQIYDTFKVADQIKNELGADKFDHELLNIASDCVINETLRVNYKKKTPPNLITAKYLKSKYNVIYLPHEDTQFSLYVKMLESDKVKEMKNDPLLKMLDDLMENEGEGEKSDIKKYEPSNSGDKPSSKEDNSNNGEESGENSEKEGTEETVSKDKKISYSNEEFKEKELLDYYDSEPENSLDDIIKKSSDTLTGPLGEFIEKLREIPKQIKKIKYGIKLNTDNKGKIDYIKVLFDKTRVILSNKLQSLQKQYKSTYTRVNRRDPHNDGGLIKKGKKINNNKVDIDISFYVDISGSMGDSTVSNIFNNLYSNTKPLIDVYKKTYNNILNEININYYSFNESINKIPMHKIPRSSGGNVSLDTLLGYIIKNTDTSLINVIITDAGFEIENSKIINALKNYDNYFIIITNNVSNWRDYDKIEQLSNKKINSIYTTTF